MDLTILDGQQKFPPEFVNPKDKEKNSYGLQYAKAMYNSGTRYGGRNFYGSQDYDALTELAQGRQSTDDMMKIMGWFGDLQNDPTKDLSFIDPRVLNLATKYVNRAVAKMQRIQYDIGLEAIDIVSIDEKKDYAATIQAFYRVRKWMDDMDYNPQTLFPDIDVDSLPVQPDEMLYDISVNPKIKKEIGGELLMQLIHSINRWDIKERITSWDLAVYGKAHVHCFADNNGVPREKRIHPRFWIGSYIDNDDWEEQEYAGFFDFPTVNQFIKETSGELTQEEQMEIVRQFQDRNATGSFVDYHRMDSYDGLGVIPVLRFYFLSEDNRRFVEKTDSFGKTFLVERSPQWRSPLSESQMREYDTSYTSVYGGTWVINSSVVYNYKRQEYPRTELVNASLPIKTMTTNFREGRTVSFLAQMAEPLFMINTAWNKIKQILAEGRMGVMEIDFNQIEEIAVGSGGKKWTPKDVMSFFFKKNILIKRGRTNQYDQKVGDAITMDAGGLQMSDYFEAFRTGVQMLESMTASSALESNQVPDRLTSGNAMMSQQLSDIDMEYLFTARETLYRRVSHQMLIIAQGSLASGKKINGFIPALGKVNLGYFDADPQIAYCEYGMMITRQPTDEEKARWYDELSIYVKEGRIAPQDSAFIREINNMKQARQILVIREKQYQRQIQEQQQQAMQQQAELNQQAADSSFQAQTQLMDKQGQIDSELMILKGRIDQSLAAMKSKDARVTQTIQGQVKRDVARQQGVDNIMKHAVSNIPDKQKVAQQSSGSAIEWAKVQVELDRNEIDRERLKIEKSKPASRK